GKRRVRGNGPPGAGVMRVHAEGTSLSSRTRRGRSLPTGNGTCRATAAARRVTFSLFPGTSGPPRPTHGGRKCALFRAAGPWHAAGKPRGNDGFRCPENVASLLGRERETSIFAAGRRRVFRHCPARGHALRKRSCVMAEVSGTAVRAARRG